MTDPADMVHQLARIVVVDDNPTNVELLLAMLEDSGYKNLLGLTDSREVAPLLERERPDLVLLDLRMPHLDGHEVLALLRHRLGQTTPPVIVLTAENSVAARHRALEQGASDFLTKPFDQTEVMQRIHNQLEAHFRSEAHRHRASELEALVAERTAELRALSLRDPLTGLPNRRALRAEIERKLGEDRPVAVYFIMLDEFDELARTQGHAICEALSREVGDMLAQSALMRNGLVSAWGDREFVLMLEHEDDAATFERNAARLLRLLGGQLIVEAIRVDLSVRIGAAHRSDTLDTAHLVQLAAAALPSAGQGEAFSRYRPEVGERLARRRLLRLALRDATAAGELELAYQPKIDLASGRLTGAEGLLRWTSPEHGPVSPAEFIPLAEASGDILAIGEWVIETGLAQLARWQAEGVVDASFSLALNVSGRQLMQAGFAARTLEAHRRHDIRAGSVELEVTESGLMEDIGLAVTQLKSLFDVGIPSAIDDFGTGYSSLSYLKLLPVSVLKIDRSFVAGINDDPTDRKLAETVVAIAHSLGCSVVAEGIENAEQARTLTAIGCETGQGYHFSRPLDAGAFARFARQDKPA